ncbi:MAG TPA: DUF2786 domain-containing protein [Desulfuromonadales bacterium]|nr:DUF2786 domain-containing protein [Desulfuromonadales bacterium]
MNPQAPIIEKIKKLLALSASSNEHEAALAASHVQRLLSEHNLALADIDASNRPDKADQIETAVAKTLPKWVRHLSAGVCDAFDCQAIHNPTAGKMTFIGVGADVQIAAYTFFYLDTTIRRLCGSYMKQHSSVSLAARQREMLRQSYYLGAVDTIYGRLQQQKRQTPITPGALVPVKQGLIRQAVQELGTIRTVHSRRSFINKCAYTQGQEDGREVGIHRGIDGGGSSPHAISH